MRAYIKWRLFILIIKMGVKFFRNKRLIIAQSRPILTKDLLEKLKQTTRMNDEEINYWFGMCNGTYVISIRMSNRFFS